MRTRRWIVAGLVCLMLGLGAARSHTSQTPESEGDYRPHPSPSTSAQVDFGKVPLYFVENAGQLDSRVAFSLRSPQATAYFTPGGVTFALSEPRPHRTPGMAGRLRPVTLTASSHENTSRNWVLKLDFVDANPNVVPRGQDQADAVVSYLIGSAAQRHSGLRTYSSIAYSEVWPGIDLVYSGTGRRLKYTFVLEPGSDANHVKLRYRGATSVERTADGRLAVNTPLKTLYEEKPYVYQEINGQRVEVAADYDIEPAAAADGQTYGFRLGEYRRDLPLILDPFFAYAGYIGDDEIDQGNGIAVDGSGNAYVVGTTTATSNVSFPETVGLGDNVLSMDAFVAKVNSAGSGFVYISYVGGFNHDTGYGIAVDGGGNAYITGYTASAGSFPHGTGFEGLTSFDSTYNGGTGDAYVAKLNADGTALLYAGYIGGSDDEAGFGIAVDSSHNAYVAGGTCSNQTSFPDGDGFGALTGPDVTYNGGSGGGAYYCDGFVAKVNPAGEQLLYAGYIGGTNYDEARSIAVQSSGQAYVTGSTGSNQSSFPETLGPDTTYNGGGDAFVAKVKSDGSGLHYAGYLGGGGKDEGNGIALRRDLIVTGQFLEIVYTALVTGSTETHAVLFPATIGPDTSHNGFHDAFVVRVKSSGSGLLFAGFIGGSGYDVGNAIAVDSNGYAYVVGLTNSDETSFPVKSGPDTTYNDNGDAFVARLKKDGTGLLYASYVGGADPNANPNFADDLALGIAVDAWGNAYITGYTQSDQTTFPDGNGFGTLGGPDTIHNGADAFVVKISNFFIYIPWPWPWLFDAPEPRD